MLSIKTKYKLVPNKVYPISPDKKIFKLELGIVNKYTKGLAKFK